MRDSTDRAGSVTLRRWLMHMWRDRVSRFLQSHRWTIIAAMWGMALTLGYAGFSQYLVSLGAMRSHTDIFYMTLQLFTMESGAVPGSVNWQLEAARLLAPATTLYTMWHALALIFSEQLHKLRIRFYFDHVVICGLGRRGILLARAFREMGVRVVAIEQDYENDRIEQCRRHGAVVLVGNACDSSVLKEARVHTARHVIALCSDDGVNAEIAVDTRKLVKDRRGDPLTCVVQIVDARLLDLLKGQELEMSEADSFRLEFFNVFERGAHKIIAEFPPLTDAASTAPHILVVGVGRMGQALVTHVARRWRTHHREGKGRIRVTVIDREADDKAEYLKIEFPLLGKVCDLRACQMDVNSPQFYRGDFLEASPDQPGVTSVYICLDNDSRAMAAGLTILKRTRSQRIPIIIRLIHEGGLAALFQDVNVKNESLGMLKPFGLLERTCTPEQVLGGTHETLARATHEEYLLLDHVMLNKTHRDRFAVPWTELPSQWKDAFRRHADHLCRMLAAVGCTLQPLTDWDAELFQFSPEQIEIMAKMEHDHHMHEDLYAGGAYFPANGSLEPAAKPAPLSWEERPEEEREAYRDVVRRLTGFLAKVDFQISPLR